MSSERFEWFYMGAHDQIGPLSESKIVDLVDNAVVQGSTLVWKVGMETWVPANSIPKFSSRFQAISPPPRVMTPPPPPTAAAVSAKSCPTDQTTLNRTVRSGVEIDWCPKCRGVWLDHGELEKLLQREAKGDYRREDDDDDYRRKGKKREGFWENVFDVFD